MKRGRLRAVIEYEPKAKYIHLATSVEIPTDCLFSIFQFCGPATFIHISPLVCKEWYAVTNEDHNWKTLCLYEWPMLELTDQSEWKMTWKELFLHYTAYLPPQLYQAYSKDIISLVAPWTSQSQVDVTEIETVLGSVQNVTNGMIEKTKTSEEYISRKENLTALYRDAQSTCDEWEKEALFLRMFAKIELDYDRGIVNIKFRTISGRLVQMKYKLGNESVYLLLTLGVYQVEFGAYCSTSKFISNLRNLCNVLGFKHLRDIMDVWIEIMGLVPSKDLTDSDRSVLKKRIDRGNNLIEQFENQQQLSMHSEEYAIDMVDVEDEEAYEKGKKFILSYPDRFEDAPKEYAKDRELVLEMLVKHGAGVFEFVDRTILDREFLEVAVKKDARSLQYFSCELYEHDEDIVKLWPDLLKSDYNLFKFVPQSLKENKDLVIQLLLHHGDGQLFEMVPPKLKEDEDVIETVLSLPSGKCHWRSVPHKLCVSERIQRLMGTACETENDCERMFDSCRLLFSSKAFVLEAVKLVPLNVFAKLSTMALQNNLEVIHVGFKKDPRIIKYVDPQVVLNDSEIQEGLKYVVTKYPELLQFACEETKCDRTLMLRLVKKNAKVMEYVSESLQSDEDFVYELCVDSYCDCLQFASDLLKNNVDFIASIVATASTWGANRQYKQLKYVPEDVLCSDKISVLLKQRISLLKAVAMVFSDVSVIKSWLDFDLTLYDYLSPCMQNNTDIINHTAALFQTLQPSISIEKATAYLNTGGRFKSVLSGKSQFQNNRQVALTAVKADGMVFQYISNNLRRDKEIVIAAVRSNPLSVKFMEGDMKSDPEVIQLALTACKSSVDHLLLYSLKKNDVLDLMDRCENICDIILSKVSSTLKQDPDLVRIAMAKTPAKSLFKEYPSLVENSDFMVSVIDKCNSATADKIFSIAHGQLGSDKKCVIALLQKCSIPSFWIGSKLREDPDVAKYYDQSKCL